MVSSSDFVADKITKSYMYLSFTVCVRKLFKTERKMLIVLSVGLRIMPLSCKHTFFFFSFSF